MESGKFLFAISIRNSCFFFCLNKVAHVAYIWIALGVAYPKSTCAMCQKIKLKKSLKSYFFLKFNSKIEFSLIFDARKYQLLHFKALNLVPLNKQDIVARQRLSDK